MKPIIFPHTEKIDFSKTLNVKFGIDPTSDKLHLGHLIPLLMVKKLWKEGHNIQIVLGTFTAQLGDPSGKDTMRPKLTSEETENNAESIFKQVSRIFFSNTINGNEVISNAGEFMVHRNGDWFQKMSAVEMIGILSNFTTTQMLSRDSFQKRISENNPIGMHELTVPILQGFDSVHLKTDVEIGGTDQLFNFGTTRDVQRIFGQNPETCILMPIMNGTDGRKMSKSFNNCIFINDIPEDVFVKTMSISDELMREWLSIFFENSIASEMNPMALKKKLAFKITKEIWSESDAEKARDHFERVIQEKNKPTELQETSSKKLIDVIVGVRKCSISEAKRLIAQGGVKVNDKTMSEEVVLSIDDIVKVGKRDFVKII